MRPSTQRKYKRHRKWNLAYGGDLLNTRLGRSTPRPFSKGAWIHVVLKSTRARGPWNFRRNLGLIEDRLSACSAKHAVKLVDHMIHHNHLHLVTQASSKDGFRGYLRAVTGSIAMAVTGAGRGRPLKGKFWDRRPYTRVVRGPMEETILMEYLDINRLEAVGIPRQEARACIARNRHVNQQLRLSRKT